MEFAAEFDKYVPGPPYNGDIVSGADNTSLPWNFQLRWLLAGFYQGSMERSQKYPEAHFPVDETGNIPVLRTLQRHILEFVEYHKFERKCHQEGKDWHFMIMVDNHIEFTALDILNLAEMLPPNTTIPPYYE